jgi:hypothetical protein
MQTLISVGAFAEHGGDAVEQHRSVSRITFRQALPAGLDEDVPFGKTFVRYETRGDRVVSFSEDGSSAEAMCWSPPRGRFAGTPAVPTACRADR